MQTILMNIITFMQAVTLIKNADPHPESTKFRQKGSHVLD